MKNILIIARRELNSYFNSAIAYIYLIVFVAINNSLFMTGYFLAGKADMKSYFDTLPFMLFIFIPVVAMRLWAEDKKENTFELLLTFPMKPAELVLGKFAGSIIFYFISLLCTVTIPVVIYLTGRPDIGSIIGGYTGAVLLGALFLAIGIFISGLVREQIIAFVLATVSCFTVFFLGTGFFASLLDGWFSGLGTFLMTHIGAASRLSGFNRGVIDIKDAIYFITTSAVFLLLNGFSLEGRLRPRAKIVFSTAVIICLAGAGIFNWLVHDINFGRFDITEGKIYTVSETAKKIFKDLKAPVTVNFYITPSEKMPTALKALETDVVGKLEELKVVSGNKLNFKVFHIEAARLIEDKDNNGAQGGGNGDSLEKSLQKKGIMPFQVESIDRDELGVKLVYTAMAVSYKEKAEEILPRILPQNIPDLEYFIVSRVLKLMAESKPKLAVYSPLRTQKLAGDMSRLLSGLGQERPQYEDDYKTIIPIMRNNGYDVARIMLTEDDPIPAGVNTLFIINPGPLNDRQLFEINKFIYQGGSVLIAAQGYDYAFEAVPPDGLEINAQKNILDINRLVMKWGVSINEDMLLDENSQMIQISTGQSVGPFALSMPVKIPNQINVPSDNMNKSVPFMMRLSSLFYLWGSSLDVSEDIMGLSGLKKTVMFTSSPRSWKSPYESGNIKKESFEFPKTGSSGKFILGLMIEGQFSNTFLQSKLPEWPAAAGEDISQASEGSSRQKNNSAGDAPAEMGGQKPGKLVIIGCARMFN
ncbi:MAG: Gldg family protein, partial [Candidatus Omnitrophota bacterium]